MRLPTRGLLLCSAALATVVIGCADKAKEGRPRRPEITGAGATFPYPLYARWTSSYLAQADVRVNYYSVGSAEGLRLLNAGTVDFGASDLPLGRATLDTIGCGGAIQVPMVAGAIAVAYQLPGVDTSIVLDRDALAAIFSGRVRRWNDPRIARLNPSVRLPDRPVQVVHRGAGSGTSATFANYLGASPLWPRATGNEPNWPVGTAEEGNEGVAARIRQTPGAIGYVEIAYARQSLLRTARIVDASGSATSPSADGVRAALALLDTATLERTGAMVNRPGAGAYPVVAISWLVIPRRYPDATRRERIVAFVRWALHEGAKEAGSLEYVPLPNGIVVHYDSLVGQIGTGPCSTAPSP